MTTHETSEGHTDKKREVACEESLCTEFALVMTIVFLFVIGCILHMPVGGATQTRAREQDRQLPVMGVTPYMPLCLLSEREVHKYAQQTQTKIGAETYAMAYGHAKATFEVCGHAKLTPEPRGPRHPESVRRCIRLADMVDELAFCYNTIMFIPECLPLMARYRNINYDLVAIKKDYVY
jgi:hypothetical protein